jgi:hypothetical protein
MTAEAAPNRISSPVSSSGGAAAPGFARVCIREVQNSIRESVGRRQSLSKAETAGKAKLKDPATDHPDNPPAP